METSKHLITTLEEFLKNKENREKFMQYKPSNRDIIVNAFTVFDYEGNLGVRIDCIIVPPLQRNKNIGRQEVERIILWAKEINATYLIVDSIRETVGFWEKMGFEIDDEGEDVSTGILRLCN